MNIKKMSSEITSLEFVAPVALYGVEQPKNNVKNISIIIGMIIGIVTITVGLLALIKRKNKKRGGNTDEKNEK